MKRGGAASRGFVPERLAYWRTGESASLGAAASIAAKKAVAKLLPGATEEHRGADA